MIYKKKRKKFDPNSIKVICNIICTKEQKAMFKYLLKEFPLIAKSAVAHTEDGVGFLFPPKNGQSKWRSLENILLDILPEINEKKERIAYEKEIARFIK